MTNNSNQPDPLVSIIIPNYNHARYLPQALDSVLAQDYPHYEIIVVDDGSTDDSRTVAARYQDRIRYIWQENRGLSAARNTGLAAARGQLIGLLDADDLYEPDFLRTMVGILQTAPEFEAVYCGHQFVDEQNRPLFQQEARAIPPDQLYPALIEGNFLVPESMLARRHCYDAVGPFDESLRACEDWDIYRLRDWWEHNRRLRQNLARVRQTIAAFEPDVIFIHVMWNLTPGIAWQAEQLCPGRVVYYVANDWPHAVDPHTAFWQDPAQSPLLNVIKRLLAPWPIRRIRQEQARFPLQFEKVLCVSNAVKKDLAVNANIPPENMAVVYNGVETDLFVPPVNGTRPADELKLLYAGSLVDHKGVHTAVEAMVLLAQNPAPAHISLTIAGGGHPDYEARLRQRVEQAGLQTRIHFAGRIPRARMPNLLQQHHVLLFPSIWEEPLARMTQEAMATEMAVVSTLTGGTGELVIEGETGLTFPPDDAAALAQRVAELALNPDLRARLGKQGRAAVLARFDLNRMIDEIESHLGEASKNSHA